jgi:hypothetical protein
MENYWWGLFNKKRKNIQKHSPFPVVVDAALVLGSAAAPAHTSTGISGKWQKYMFSLTI